MNQVFKFVVESIIGDLKLFDNSLANYIVIGFLLLVSFIPAWKVTGWLYDNKIISSKNSGSFIHWVIRLIVALACFGILKICLVVTLVVKNYWLQLTILLMLGVIVYYAIKYCETEYKKIRGRKNEP